jgi:hypothetical protein
MLKFLVQTFYQPFFSHTFSFSNFPLAILFPSKSFPHQKGSKQNNQAKGKKPQTLLQGPFINRGKQGGAEALGEERDIVTGETCGPTSLNTSLGDAAVLLFSVSWPGLCLSWPTDESN